MSIESKELTPEEYEYANSVVQALRRKYTATDTRSLGDYLRIWDHIVTRVEEGYKGIAAEYQNDLTYRNMLEEVRQSVPEDIGIKLATLLRPLDVRFFEATQEAARPLFVGKVRDREFWWFRVPRALRFYVGLEDFSRTTWAPFLPAHTEQPPEQKG